MSGKAIHRDPETERERGRRKWRIREAGLVDRLTLRMDHLVGRTFRSGSTSTPAPTLSTDISRQRYRPYDGRRRAPVRHRTGPSRWQHTKQPNASQPTTGLSSRCASRRTRSPRGSLWTITRRPPTGASLASRGSSTCSQAGCSSPYSSGLRASSRSLRAREVN